MGTIAKDAAEFTTADIFLSGTVGAIRRHSQNDGPGLRTAVELSSCPPRCPWCAFWPTGSRASDRLAVVEVVEECLQDRAEFDATGGGVTVCGGEPLMQDEFTLHLLRQLHLAGVHTALRTTAHASPIALALVVPWVDLFVIDLFHLDRDEEGEWSLGDRRVRANIATAIRTGKEVQVRLVVPPGSGDTARRAQSFAELTAGLDIPELIPFTPDR